MTMVLERLSGPSWSVMVWPGRRLVLTEAEAEVIATRPFQRLRRLRQIGLYGHAAPLADHTRYAHTIGTVWWTAELMRSLDDPAADSDGPRHLAAMRQILADEGASLDLVVRLFALIHDIALLPFGHTLRFQLGLIHDADSFTRCFRRAVDNIGEEIRPNMADRPSAEALLWHLELAVAVAHAPRLLAGHTPAIGGPRLDTEVTDRLMPVLTFVYDLVHGVYGADIIDVCWRDLFAAGRVWDLPASLPVAGQIIVCRPGDPAWPAPGRTMPASIFRYGIQAMDGDRVLMDRLTDLSATLDLRYEVAEKAFFHPRKCAADTMLDKALRSVDDHGGGDLSAGRPPFTDLDLLEMGDDAFLDLVAQREAAIGEGVRAARDLQAGRIWPEMVHLDGRGLAALEDQVCDSLTAPAGRSSAERRLAGELGIPAEHVALRLAPRRMQAKAPDTPIGWRNGQAIPFDRLCREQGVPLSAASLPMRYAGLRDLSLYVREGATVAPITAGRLIEILGGVACA